MPYPVAVGRWAHCGAPGCSRAEGERTHSEFTHQRVEIIFVLFSLCFVNKFTHHMFTHYLNKEDIKEYLWNFLPSPVVVQGDLNTRNTQTGSDNTHRKGKASKKQREVEN